MTDDELDKALAALPRRSPAANFADRVMARVAVPPVAADRSASSARRPSRAVAAVIAVAVTAMGASVLWTMSHQATLTELGQWLMMTASEWAWREAKAAAATMVTWAGAIPRMENQHMPFLATIAALGPLVYLGGLIALRHLMTSPTRQVVHVER